MDADTGLVYAQQRYYDPIVGRFLSVDPVTADAGSGGNFNRYWYANNNPYRFTDPDGRDFISALINRATAIESGSQAAVDTANKQLVGEGIEVGKEVARNAGAAVTSVAKDRLSVSATAGVAKGTGVQINASIANDSDSASLITAGDGAFAGVFVNIKIASFEVSGDSPFSVDFSAIGGDLAAGGVSLMADPGGEVTAVVSVGLGVGALVNFGPKLTVKDKE